MEDSYDTYKKYLQSPKVIKETHKIQALKRLYTGQLKIIDKLICYEWASLAGGVLVSFMPEVYIIETHNHAVNFDSENTWDFFANALFENYRYPQLTCPAPVPIWEEIPIDTKLIKKFYSKDVMQTASAKKIGYKRIYKL